MTAAIILFADRVAGLVGLTLGGPEIGGRGWGIPRLRATLPLPLPLPLPLLLLLFSGCATLPISPNAPPSSLTNFAHLNHLTETVEKNGEELAIVHIYSEAPDYGWVHDDDEGAACVDDAARAAVVFMRDVELTGNAGSRRKAEALLRFLLYMQAENGLFYNFVWNSDLDINTEHQNSRADDLSWWTARSVWALGRCAEVFAGEEMATRCVEAARRTFPHLESRLQAYGETFEKNGRRYPRWLLHETASDATSELLLGLSALNRAQPSERLDAFIRRFAEGMQMMQYGRIGVFPYGAHASWTETWHAWGNAQTQALGGLKARAANEAKTVRGLSAAAVAGDSLLASAVHEAEHFYPFLLVDGWRHSIDFDDPSQGRRFEQIAYGARGVVLGLLGLYDATGEARYATLAGLAASWFTGNNPAAAAMYDPETGRGYDGIGSPNVVNRNAGAESTIEALMSMLEVDRVPEARKWLFARGDTTPEVTRNSTSYRYRIFQVDDPARERVGIILNLTDQTSMLLHGADLADFLDE